MSGGKNVFEPRKEIETDVFSLLLQAWDKEENYASP